MNHRASVEGVCTETFVCAACNYTAPVLVAVRGEGKTSSPLFMGMADNRELAQKIAADAFHIGGQRTLGLVACPHCGATNRKARTYAALNATKFALLFVGFGFLALLLTSFWFPSLTHAREFAGALVIGGLCGVLFYSTQLRAAKNAAHFGAGLVATRGPQLVGSACVTCAEKIFIATDAALCGSCATPVHNRCATAHAC